MRNCNKRAFTLIEMLLVVAIIAILAMLLYPALGRIRESGRSTRCVSNLRQLQVAAINYAGGNGWLPECTSYWHSNDDGTKSHWHGWVAWYNIYGASDSQGSGGNYAWYGANGYASVTNGSLWGYVKNSDVYYCPTFAMSKNCNRSDTKWNYAMNNQISTRDVTTVPGQQINVLGMEATKTFMFCDNTLANLSTAYPGMCASNNMATAAARWHGPKGNVIYVDGHVEQY